MSAQFRTIRPGTDEIPSYAAGYVARVPDGDIVDVLSRQIAETVALLESISESNADYRYEPEKWSIKEVVGHIGDAERIFAYRALRFARADATPVEGFDENTYVIHAPFTRTTLVNLTNELEHIRRSTLHLFANLDSEAMQRRGTANGLEVSVRALAFIIAGHENHHLNILRTRYLKQKAE
jgi:hypothetical protein